MSERAVRFNAAEVRAILDGSKTQARWPVKHQGVLDVQNEAGSWDGPCEAEDWVADRCPYGVPGDRLWVQETWAAHPLDDDSDPPTHLMFRADGTNWWAWPLTEGITDWERGHPSDDMPNWAPRRWKPSVRMPRWASRIALGVAVVRVERGDEGWEWVIDFKRVETEEEVDQ